MDEWWSSNRNNTICIYAAKEQLECSLDQGQGHSMFAFEAYKSLSQGASQSIKSLGGICQVRPIRYRSFIECAFLPQIPWLPSRGSGTS